MPTRREFLKAGAIAATGVLGYSRSLCAYSPDPLDVTGTQSLRAHAERHGLLVGCAVVPEKLNADSDYARVIAEQANILVAENAMKWRALRPSPDRFDFHSADVLMEFAAKHNQKVRGHNLCWHESIPDWFAGTVTKENARQILEQHIRTVAGRYAGKLHSWDVVNEAIDMKGGQPDGLRRSPWFELIGPDYIELAFRAAKQADPTALLTYNDYGIELDTPEQAEKRAHVLALVKRLKTRGVPIEAVGVQSHLSATDPQAGAGLQHFVRELRQMGLQVFVTELDVNERKLEGSIAERDAAVAGVYRGYLHTMLSEPNVHVVLTWGITDRYTWLNSPKYARLDGQQQRPLPFDEEYRPTSAFFALRDAIDKRISDGYASKAAL